MKISDKIASQQCYVFSHKLRQSIALNEVIYRAGSISVLSTFLGIPRQAVCRWQKQGWVPLERALEIEYIYGVPYLDLIRYDLALRLSEALAAEQAGIFLRRSEWTAS